MRRWLLTRWRWIAAAIMVLAVASLVVLNLRGEPPEEVEQLERASEAGERAQSTSAEIVENLEAIAAHLEAGRNFPEQSAEIQSLTRRQEQSLRELAGILQSQLKSLRETQESLSGTRAAVTGVAELGAEQQALLERALAALERIESFAQRASERAADFAWRARYGARLAEDSQRSFSR